MTSNFFWAVKLIQNLTSNVFKVDLNSLLKLNFIDKIKHICTCSITGPWRHMSHGDCFVTILYAQESFWVANGRWLATIDEKKKQWTWRSRRTFKTVLSASFAYYLGFKLDIFLLILIQPYWIVFGFYLIFIHIFKKVNKLIKYNIDLTKHNFFFENFTAKTY